MKKALTGLFVLAVLAAFAVPSESFAAQRVEVRLAPVGTTYAPPRLGRNQGWLTITNRDWKPYTLLVTGKGRISISQGALPNGTVIRSGNSVTMAVDRDIWRLLGSSGRDLRVRVREGRASTVTLEPFGFVNDTGLRGTANDGNRVTNAVLIDSGPPVIVHQPPVVVHRPPVVVHTPPPVIVAPPRPGRPIIGRPGPDRDRDRNDRNDRDRNDRDRNDNDRDRNDRDRNDRDRNDREPPFGGNRR